MREPLLERTECGIYCRPGRFFIDPWKPVDFAAITHAHSDHARPGSGSYLASAEGREILEARLGSGLTCQWAPYGERVERNGVSVSLHPAGHVLGSAQVRLEWRGQVAVVSGDYKRQRDPTCQAFEPVRCNLFVTESTFGLPIYRWDAPETTMAEVNSWWRANSLNGRNSVLFAYSLGKTQRLLAGLDASIGPIIEHGASTEITAAYRRSGVALPATLTTISGSEGIIARTALVLAPPSAAKSTWMRRFEPYCSAFASGWMRARGPRRRMAVDRGFAISDHADWTGLLTTVNESCASEIWATHGYGDALARFLRTKGFDAAAVDTRFVGERPGDEPEEDVSDRRANDEWALRATSS